MFFEFLKRLINVFVQPIADHEHQNYQIIFISFVLFTFCNCIGTRCNLNNYKDRQKNLTFNNN